MIGLIPIALVVPIILTVGFIALLLLFVLLQLIYDAHAFNDSVFVKVIVIVSSLFSSTLSWSIAKNRLVEIISLELDTHRID